MKPRIAWFSPLLIEGASAAVGSSTSAYVSELLLPELSQKFDLDLYHNGFETYRDFPTYHYLSAFRRHREKPYDLFFYQIEDGPASYFTRSHIGLSPGVVYYHDILFKDEGPEPFHYSPWREISARFRDENAPWAKRGEFPKRQIPFGARERALSLLPLFSSERDLSEQRRLVEGKGIGIMPGVLLPYPVRNLPLQKRDDGVFSVAFLGGFEIEHRAHKVLSALRELGRPYQLRWLIDEQEGSPVEALLREFKITSCELVSGRSPLAWTKLVQGADLAIHTLFSGYGDAGPYLPISLMAGAPVIVTNFGAAEFLPDKVVIKIQPGESEARELVEALRLIGKGGEMITDLVSTAHSYVTEFHSVRTVAHELGDLLNRSIPALSGAMAKWEEVEQAARRSLISEISLRWDERVGATGSAPQAFKRWHEVLAPTFSELDWEQSNR